MSKENVRAKGRVEQNVYGRRAPEIAGTTARTRASKMYWRIAGQYHARAANPERTNGVESQAKTASTQKAVTHPRSRRAKPQKRAARKQNSTVQDVFFYIVKHINGSGIPWGPLRTHAEKDTVEARNTAVRVDQTKRKLNVDFDGGEADPAGLYGGFECIYHGLIEL